MNEKKGKKRKQKKKKDKERKQNNTKRKKRNERRQDKGKKKPKKKQTERKEQKEDKRKPFSLLSIFSFCFVLISSFFFFFFPFSDFFSKGVCVIYDVNEEDPELHRKIGKCRQPTEAEIKKRKEDNKKINKRAEQRITNKKHWKF